MRGARGGGYECERCDATSKPTPHLPPPHLTDLNLSSNHITTLQGLHHLHALRKLDLSSNRINAFETISDVLLCSGIVELEMSNNVICCDAYYRRVLVHRCKGLKVLDGRRVGEEERRGAARVARREAERRKACVRVEMVSEEK